jgi:hypothetical protein
MTREEILAIAKYIQYPLTKTSYYTYNTNINIHKLPLPADNQMYNNWPLNYNHFTMEYHRQYAIPLLCELLDLNYNENDFIIDERKSKNNFDISLLKSKQDYIYEIYGYTRDEHFDNLTFQDITHNTKCDTEYHELYKYSHECSRLINKTINNNRKLFISGDSQMIPDISFLSCFFKEIFYFDNRNGLNLSHTWKDTTFTDALIELNCVPLQDYTEINFL